MEATEGEQNTAAPVAARMEATEGEQNTAAPEPMEIDWGTQEDLALVRSIKEIATSIPCLSSWFVLEGSWDELTRMIQANGFYRDSSECKARFMLLCSTHKETLLAEENGATGQDDVARANHEVVAELRKLLPLLSAPATARPAVSVRRNAESDGDNDDRHGRLNTRDRGSSCRRRNASNDGASSVTEEARPRTLHRLVSDLGHKISGLKAELRDLKGEVREVELDARAIETAMARLALMESRTADRRLRRAARSRS